VNTDEPQVSRQDWLVACLAVALLLTIGVGVVSLLVVRKDLSTPGTVSPVAVVSPSSTPLSGPDAYLEVALATRSFAGSSEREAKLLNAGYTLCKVDLPRELAISIVASGAGRPSMAEAESLVRAAEVNLCPYKDWMPTP